MKPKIKLHKLIRGHELSLEQYHATPDTWSSSQYKDLLDDPDVFIKKYIEKSVPRETIAAFDVGTYFHTGILEPHKLKDDTIVFPGKMRRGEKWERFKKKHSSKAIVTQSQKEQAVGLVKSVKASPIAQDFLDGTPEISLFVQLMVHEGQIYAPHYGKVLTRAGWEDGAPKKTKGAFLFVTKVRADMLSQEYISDLKSTTGNACSNRSMREKISYYQYDLSAALYLDIFGLVYPNLLTSTFVDGVECCRFVWIFASKDFYNSRSYHGSLDNHLVGRAKYMKAMIRMADCAASGWQSVDYLDVLEPLPYEREYLKERDADLL